MTTTRTGLRTSTPRAGVTPEDVLGRAEALVPLLAGKQAETEQRTYYSEEVHEEFRRGGFYGVLVPSRYGGLELGIGTFLELVRILAKGCPSTAWMYCLGAAHALAVGTVFPERTQAELFAGRDFICPATVVPAGTARRTADGWEISGTWSYCSGAPYATHLIAHALVADGDPRPLLFVARRDQWRRLDDWGDGLGLRGSGSHGIELDGAVVADHLTMRGHLSNYDVAGGTPGLALHGPDYGGGPLSFMNLEVAALTVGIAQGAVDLYADLLRTRRTTIPPTVARSEDPDYQFWYAEALTMVATAEAALRGAVAEWRECAERREFNREHDLRLAGITRHVIALCWRAVEQHVIPTAGTSGMRRGERLERVWRDLSTAHSHAGLAVLLPTVAMRDLARVRLLGDS